MKCFNCNKEIKESVAINDEAYCQDCADEMEARAENAYEVARDEGRLTEMTAEEAKAWNDEIKEAEATGN